MRAYIARAIDVILGDWYIPEVHITDIVENLKLFDKDFVDLYFPKQGK